MVAQAFRLRRLAHVALATPDPPGLAAFYAGHAGLEPVREDGQGTVYVRSNADHHCLAVFRGERPGVHHVAFDVGSREELLAAAAALDRAGVPRAAPCADGHPTLPAFRSCATFLWRAP